MGGWRQPSNSRVALHRHVAVGRSQYENAPQTVAANRILNGIIAPIRLMPGICAALNEDGVSVDCATAAMVASGEDKKCAVKRSDEWNEYRTNSPISIDVTEFTRGKRD
jgi:hypothetical protein